jgi:predicted flap endonuclease-1-like 5' DNA nuclease
MPNGWGSGTRVKLEKIEGIGPKYAKRLKKAGISTLHSLFTKGMDRKGRRQIAKSTGLSEKLVLEWVNRADLFRIKGVGEEYSDLLEKAGVDTVVELAQRKPENLHEMLVKVNESKNAVRKLPAESQVKDWVKQAKSAKRMIEY